MKIKILAGFLLMSAGAIAQAQTTSNSTGHAASDAGAFATTGAVTNNFEAGEQRRHTSVSTTPNVYAPPSMFGGANNCMGSDTLGVSVTGIGVGGSKSKESVNCNAREDIAIWSKAGLMDVGLLRFACFGADENRKAYEAAGYVCPASASAKGIEGAPVGPKIAVATPAAPAPRAPTTIRMRINQDGSVTPH